MIRFWREVNTKYYRTTTVCTKYSVDVSNNIYNNQSITIEIIICSTPDASVLYQYKTFDYDIYIFQELTQ